MMNGTPGNIFAVGMILFIGTLALSGCKGEAGPPPAPPMPEVQVIEASSDRPRRTGIYRTSRGPEYRRDSPQATGIIKHRFFPRDATSSKATACMRSILPFRAA